MDFNIFPQILEYLFNDLKRKEGKANFQQAKLASKKVFTSLNLEKSYGSLFEIMWNAQIPCFDTPLTSAKNHDHGLLKSCSWKGVKMPCSAIFKVRSRRSHSEPLIRDNFF